MLLLFVARLEAPSSRLVAAVTLIAAGVALASYGELNLSLVGGEGRGAMAGLWNNGHGEGGTGGRGYGQP